MLFVLAYTKSLFGYQGKNTVMVQEGDSYEVIGTVPTPTNIKSILEGNFSDPPIKDENEYPWIGHAFTCNQTSLTTEVDNMKAAFCKNIPSLTQDQLYYHPAGIKQFVTNETFIEEIKKSPRLKLRMFINTRQDVPHWTTLYALPGEIITIEIPEWAINHIVVTMNREARTTSFGTKTRYPDVNCWFTLTSKINKFGYPLGGSLDLGINLDFANNGLEINISGGIRMPYFRYGDNSDQEWEEELRNYRAPLAIVDSGAIVDLFPADRVLNQIRMNDGCGFWRTVSQVFYSINDVTSYGRRADGRVKHPVLFNFDSWVATGAAYSVQGAEFIQAPITWADAMMNYLSDIWGCWGNVHEYGHQFQSGWGISGTGETTNNAVNFITYALLTDIDSTRQTTMANEYLHYGTGWERVTHEFGMMNAFNGYDGPLTWYGNMVYYFGPDKWRQCLWAHVHQLYFKRNSTYTYESEFVSHCAMFFNRDLREYFLSFDFINSSLITSECNAYLDKLNLKPFHPVSNIFAVGYVIDGEEFETHKPYSIPARTPYYFDFEKTMMTRSGMHNFSFYALTVGQGKFEKLSDDGKYKYTPTSNTSIVDKFYVDYKDKTNGDITRVVIKVKQIFKGCKMSYMALPQATYSSAESAYETYYKNLGYIPTTVLRGDNGIKVWQYSSHNAYVPWVGVTEGVFIPTQSGTYRFSFKHNEDCIFYFTEDKLTGDPSNDNKYIIATVPKTETNYNKNQNTTDLNLTAGTKYNFRFVLLNQESAGIGTVGYSINGSSFVDVPSGLIYYPECDDTDVDVNTFVPRFEQDPTLGKYYDNVQLSLDKRDWKLTKYPTPNNNKSDIPTLLFDGIKTNQDALCIGDFPLTYTVDFGDYLTFDRLNLPFRTDKKMNSTIELYCDGMKSLTYEFNSSTYDIWFGHARRCKKLDIVVLNNSFGNYSSLVEIEPYLTRISTTKNIIPATHAAFSVNDNEKCVLTRNGLYYNGKGWKLPEGCSLSIKIPLNSTGDSIGIVGDRSYFNGGIFEVYVNGDYHGKYNTSYVTAANYINNSQKIYQTALYGIRELTPSTTYSLEIKVTKGEVGIAGLLADTNMTITEEAYAQMMANVNDKSSKVTTAFVVRIIVASLTVVAVLAAAIGIVVSKYFSNNSTPERSEQSMTVV